MFICSLLFQSEGSPHPLDMPLGGMIKTHFYFLCPSPVISHFLINYVYNKVAMEFTKGQKTHVKHYVFKIIGINIVKAELTVTNDS